MLTREQIDMCAAYADQRAYDGGLEEWLAAFGWYARELVRAAREGAQQP